MRTITLIVLMMTFTVTALAQTRVRENIKQQSSTTEVKKPVKAVKR